MYQRCVLLVVALLSSCLLRGQVPVGSNLNYVGDTLAAHTLDIFLPEQGNGPYKVIVSIAGSGWALEETKEAVYKDFGKELTAAGFAVVTVNHRSSRRAPFPAQVHDIKAAIRYIRAHAEEYHLDTSFIGITGGSSGGHLSSFMGTTNGVKWTTAGNTTMNIEGTLGEYTAYRSDVDAVVDWFGPIHIRRMHDNRQVEWVPMAIELFIGGGIEGREDICTLANPAYYVDRQDVPYLLIHGDSDKIVPINESIYFAEQLKSHDLLDNFVTVEKGDHGPGVMIPEYKAMMVEFFCRIANRANEKQ